MATNASQYSILVVEDNQDLVIGLQDFLRHDGYVVTVAGTVADAIELVRTHRFNAIILDLGLPDGDGLQVLRDTHRLNPSLPVVVVTAHIAHDRTVGALAEGAYAYLTKPYEREELRHTLRRAIGVNELVVKVEQTEHLLSQSEERFRSLVDSATDTILVADRRGRVLSCNRAAFELFGYAAEEMIGQPITLLMPARYRHAHEQGLVRMETTGKGRVMGSTIEVHGLKKDGTEFSIELSLATWSTNNQRYYSGIIRDISERKKTEDALRRNEQLLHDVVNNTTAVIYVKYADGRYLLANRPFEQLFHLTADQIVGHTDHEIFPREIADAFRVNDLQVLKQNRTVEYEEQAPHEDGMHTYLSIKFPLCDQTGTPYATCGISTDITERKQTEEALRHSEERFRTMFMQAPIGMALIDSLTGHFYEANSKYAQMSGRTKEDMLSLNWMSITHPDDVQADLHNMSELNAGNIPGFQMEKRYVHPDGTVVWVTLTVVPIKVNAHVGPRHLAMVEDITERKRDEEMRQEMHLALVHAMPGISRLDSGGRYLAVNEMYARALGYDPSELIGGEWVDTVSPAYRPHAEAAYKMMLRKGTGEFEAIAVRKDGSTFWKQVLMVKILDRDGSHVGHHCFMRDITERKSIEHNLRSLTEQLHLALTSAEVGTWNWDLRTDRVYWSSQVDRFLDLSDRAQLRTKYDWQALVYREDRDSMVRAMRQAMDQANNDVTFQHRVMKLDCSLLSLVWTGEIIRDHDGKALHILGTVRVTDHGA